LGCLAEEGTAAGEGGFQFVGLSFEGANLLAVLVVLFIINLLEDEC